LGPALRELFARGVRVLHDGTYRPTVEQLSRSLQKRSFAQQVLVGAQAEFVDEVRMLGQ
jgi:hypothetical protein